MNLHRLYRIMGIFCGDVFITVVSVSLFFLNRKSYRLVKIIIINVKVFLLENIGKKLVHLVNYCNKDF